MGTRTLGQMQKNPCSLTFFVVAVIASFAWIFYVSALTTPGDFVFGLPLPPKENAETGFFHVPRADMPGVGGDSSDMGWMVAKYQALASDATGPDSYVPSDMAPQQTVHAELGLGRVYARASQFDRKCEGPGKEDCPFVNHRGFKTWAEVCGSIQAWAPGSTAFAAASRFTLCDTAARTQIYDLWGFATLVALCTAGVSWFICLCPQKVFRRIGGAVSLLGALLGLVALLKWNSAIAQFEDAAGGCGGVLGVSIDVAISGLNTSGVATPMCTNWTQVLGGVTGSATGPALAASGACAYANATYWKLPLKAGAGANMS